MSGEQVFQNTARLVTLFTFIALVVSSVGVFGIMSFEVGRLQREIGIRISIGADRASIVSLLIREIMYPALLGIACGCLLSLMLNKLLKDNFFGVARIDFGVFILVAVIIFFVIVIAAIRPIGRALKLDPMEALRYE